MLSRSMLTFGIEQEHFIFKNGLAPTTHDIQELFINLNNHGFKTISQNGKTHIGTVAKQTHMGLVYIKNDFCTHILEIAFPPCHTINDFSEIYDATFETLHIVFELLNLKIKYGGCLAKLPENIILYAPNPETSLRQHALISRKIQTKPLAEVYFFAAICATQVHLDVDEHFLYQYLPQFYAYDYLAILLSSNSKVFNQIHAHCIRPLIYHNSFDNGYIACGFPSKIPTTRNDYEIMKKSSVNFIKDYSLIIPREDTKTIEFRSSCSQNTSEEIIALTALRIAILRIIEKYPHQFIRKDQSFYYHVCKTGRVDPQLLYADIKKLQSIIQFMPKEFAKYIEIHISQLNTILNNVTALSE